MLDIMDELRVKCPWDREQTNESLRANTIEETYELSEAILADNNDEIKKELGDLLLHVIFYSKIGEEKQAFDAGAVCNAISDKLIFRHPHVFGDEKDRKMTEMPPRVKTSGTPRNRKTSRQAKNRKVTSSTDTMVPRAQ